MRTRSVVTAIGVALALFGNHAIAASAGNPTEPPKGDTGVSRLLEDADRALQAGNLNLALIQLKNAVRLAPSDGEARAQLGVALLRSGQAAAAEVELRQAQRDYGSYQVVVPALLAAMLARNKFKELLGEFPEPAQVTQDQTTPDILAARAIALQRSGQPKEARAAMDRAVALRRDTEGLIRSSRLAQQQGDLALARRENDEALKLSPTNEAALSSSVALAREAGDTTKALANADAFAQRAPGSLVAKLLRIDLLLNLKEDQKARQDVEALLKQTPKSFYGHYYRGVLMARDKDVKGAWREVQNLPTEFVQSEWSIAEMVSGIAVASGNSESGGAILTTFIAHHPDDRVARVQLAGIRLDQNAPQAALEVLAPLQASDDPSVHALVAQAYIAMGRFDEAIPSLEIASAAPNASILLKRQLALLQLRTGENDHAIQGLRDLMQRGPVNVQTAAPLIAALVRTAKWDEALALADSLVAKAPSNPLPAFFRGQIFIARGNLAEAASEFTKALALDPKFVPALYYRASISMARGNLENAKKDLQLIITQGPTNILAYIRLSEIALQNGQDQEAVEVLNRAIKTAPNVPTPRLALANYQVSQQKYDDAEATVNDLLRVSPKNPEAIALQGQVQLLRGKTTEAVATFRALVVGNTSSPGAYTLLARAFYASKNQRAAEDAMKKGIELAPDSSQLRMELINMQIGGGRTDYALETARKYKDANPGPDADLLVAETLLRLKRVKEAESVLDTSLSAKPDSRVAARLSQIAVISKDYKKASAILTNWVVKNPNDFVLRRQYAALLMESGDLAGARKEHEALLKQHPEDPLILNNLSWLLQKDDPERALSLASLAAKIAPQSPEIADTLGWMKYQRQDHQGALPLLQRAHSLDAASAVISYHLARVLDATGKRAEAKTLLQTTLAKNPKFDGSNEAAQMLARW
jgi:putative PEP-CTERM system TPR-repeat lipoprotein